MEKPLNIGMIGYGFMGRAHSNAFTQAGHPRELVTLVNGYADTGKALITGGVDKVVFTGSLGNGKRVLASAAETLTPVSLELGGKDPMVVCADADIHRAAAGAVWGAFQNSGKAR